MGGGGSSTPIKLQREAWGSQRQIPFAPSPFLPGPRQSTCWIPPDTMDPQPLLLFLCLLLPASQSPVHSPQLMLEILGSDLAILLSGREAGDPLPPLSPSAPPLGGQPHPRPPTLPPEHPWLPLLQELARTQPRRLRGWAQKAAKLGCFGIKLDRIGTFSGLGC